jgi:hypothetical protein
MEDYFFANTKPERKTNTDLLKSIQETISFLQEVAKVLNDGSSSSNNDLISKVLFQPAQEKTYPGAIQVSTNIDAFMAVSYEDPKLAKIYIDFVGMDLESFKKLLGLLDKDSLKLYAGEIHEECDPVTQETFQKLMLTKTLPEKLKTLTKYLSKESMSKKKLSHRSFSNEKVKKEIERELSGSNLEAPIVIYDAIRYSLDFGLL